MFCLDGFYDCMLPYSTGGMDFVIIYDIFSQSFVCIYNGQSESSGKNAFWYVFVTIIIQHNFWTALFFCKRLHSKKIVEVLCYDQHCRPIARDTVINCLLLALLFHFFEQLFHFFGEMLRIRNGSGGGGSGNDIGCSRCSISLLFVIFGFL